eukprot:5303152-Pyramimonas_sp.AAC.1
MQSPLLASESEPRAGASTQGSQRGLGARPAGRVHLGGRSRGLVEVLDNGSAVAVADELRRSWVPVDLGRLVEALGGDLDDRHGVGADDALGSDGGPVQ